MRSQDGPLWFVVHLDATSMPDAAEARGQLTIPSNPSNRPRSARCKPPVSVCRYPRTECPNPDLRSLTVNWRRLIGARSSSGLWAISSVDTRGAIPARCRFRIPPVHGYATFRPQCTVKEPKPLAEVVVFVQARISASSHITAHRQPSTECLRSLCAYADSAAMIAPRLRDTA